MTTGAPHRTRTRELSVALWKDPGLKGNLLAAPSSLWFLLFLLIPLFFIVAYGFATTRDIYVPTFEQMTLEHYLSVLNPGGLAVRLTVQTVIFSVATTAAAAIVSYPVAYLVARRVTERTRGILVGLLIIPFWISFVVQLYALLQFVQPDGFIDQGFQAVGLGGASDWLLGNLGMGTSAIVVIVLVYIWVPFMILPLFTSLLSIDRELFEAAQNLGAGPWRVFWNVTFPLSFRGLVTGSILVFITALGSFVEPGIFAGKDQVMVGQFIYDDYLSPGRLPLGAAASIFLVVFTVPLLYLYGKYAEGQGSGGADRFMKVLDALGDGASRLARLTTRRFRPTQETRPDGGESRGVRPRRGRLERAFDAVAERQGTNLLRIFGMVMMLGFYIPLAMIVFFSFNAGSNSVQFSGFSLKWYVPDYSTVAGTERAFFADFEMIAALQNSFLIGLISTGLSLLVGTLAALALVRHPMRGKRYLNTMLYTGLVIPSIVLGISISLFIVFLNDYVIGPLFGATWIPGYASIIVGHTTFSIPIVIVLVVASLKEFDRSLEEAAMDLGADEISTFFRVTLPVLKPALISAGLLAFTFSFDELIVTIFLQGQGVTTLPVQFWSLLGRRVPTPELNAASTIIIAMSVAFVLLANKLQKGGGLFRL